MRWKSKPKIYSLWHKWYAWHPVMSTDCYMIWLETVERKRIWVLRDPRWEYRLLLKE